jgi:hypothetical protein
MSPTITLLEEKLDFIHSIDNKEVYDAIWLLQNNNDFWVVKTYTSVRDRFYQEIKSNLENICLELYNSDTDGFLDVIRCQRWIYSLDKYNRFYFVRYGNHDFTKSQFPIKGTLITDRDISLCDSHIHLITRDIKINNLICDN